MLAWVKSLFSAVIVLVVVFVGFLLGSDNSDSVRLNLFGWQSPSISIFVWIVAALALGVLMGGFLVRLAYLGRRLAQPFGVSRTQNKAQARSEKITGVSDSSPASTRPAEQSAE